MHLVVFKIIALYVTLTHSFMSEAELYIDNDYTSIIKLFLENERNTLEELKRFKSLVSNIHAIANGSSSYLNDPINSFLVAKRLMLDWHFAVVIATFNTKEFLTEMLKLDSSYRTNFDLMMDHMRQGVFKITKNCREGVTSVNEIIHKLLNYPLGMKVTDCIIFFEILKSEYNNTGEEWKAECERLSHLTDDPLIEIYDLFTLQQYVYNVLPKTP